MVNFLSIFFKNLNVNTYYISVEDKFAIKVFNLPHIYNKGKFVLKIYRKIFKTFQFSIKTTQNLLAKIGVFEVHKANIRKNGKLCPVCAFC